MKHLLAIALLVIIVIIAVQKIEQSAEIETFEIKDYPTNLIDTTKTVAHDWK